MRTTASEQRWPLRRAAGVCLAAVLLSAGLLARQRQHSGGAEAAETIRLTREIVCASVVERGVLVTADRTPIYVAVQGQILEIEQTGTPVKAGARLLRMDDVAQLDGIRDQSFQIGVREIERGIEEAKYHLAEIEESRELELDRERLRHAELEESIETRGLTPEERRLLEIEIELARLDLEDGQSEHERQQRLFDKGYITATALEPFSRRVESASAYVSELQLKISLREKALPEERRVELRENVRRAASKVERGRKAMERRLDALLNSVAKKDAEIARNRFRLADLERQVTEANVVSPADGIFVIRLFRDWRSGGVWREYRPGAHIWGGGDTIADIIDPASMRIELNFSEVDFPRIRKGLPVRIRIPSFPDRTFTGVVAELGGVGRDRYELAQLGHETAHTGVTQFNAVIDFDGQGIAFHPGMSAECEVQLEEPRAQLVVPRSAVAFRDGSPGVLVAGRWTPFEGRILNEHYVVVDGGLAEGDRIETPRSGGPALP